VIDLVYKYQEPVFDPSDPASANLAAMIGAQLALNYGLFFRRIVFHGVFDAADRRFLQDMTDNTSREIYVKKFLEPNPFLIGDAADMTVVRKPRYTNAVLEFPDASPGAGHGAPSHLKPLPPAVEPPPGRSVAHAILSSGGKDSLLTYGLLNELGLETHPIYLNESGRHWYTALNAYRHFRDHVPNTARVWVNSDRLFAWMLRRLPFIRKDFATVRSDEYPVRLWSVAVFLFGALPLLRKRGIGRLLIGDEYDTTVVSRYRGIPHYNGLYDQSRYFDRALTRYFTRKGWGIRQFSILRPLSELMIQTILVTRYPGLQAHQVSCHAAHESGGRILPCGRCEKCRRIVGMLTAVGADPARCGYGPDQIAACLEALKRAQVHQESAGAQHMAWLLSERRVMPCHVLRSGGFLVHSTWHGFSASGE
ncbi:MAG TPA: creatininase family protein, partial [bacterium]|nr:creatininase family protein [bacterium]